MKGVREMPRKKRPGQLHAATEDRTRAEGASNPISCSISARFPVCPLASSGCTRDLSKQSCRVGLPGSGAFNNQWVEGGSPRCVEVSVLDSKGRGSHQTCVRASSPKISCREGAMMAKPNAAADPR